jgi:hypothetical protein
MVGSEPRIARGATTLAPNVKAVSVDAGTYASVSTKRPG